MSKKINYILIYLLIWSIMIIIGIIVKKSILFDIAVIYSLICGLFINYKINK